MEDAKKKRRRGPYKRDENDARKKELIRLDTKLSEESNLKFDISGERNFTDYLHFMDPRFQTNSSPKTDDSLTYLDEISKFPEHSEGALGDQRDFEPAKGQVLKEDNTANKYHGSLSIDQDDVQLEEMYMYELSDENNWEEYEDCVELLNDSDTELDFDKNNFTGENAENILNEDDQLLYPGASVSIGSFMLLFTSFIMKHSISSDGILQLLNIFSYVLPSSHILCTSLYDYKKFFCNLKNPLVKHFYCVHCLGYLKSNTETTCPYNGCRKLLNENDIMYFLEMPVENQVRNFFSQEGFFEKLQVRFQGQNRDGKYRDVYDGQLYKSYCENDGPLSQPENISFTFNTDGAPVFKSSKVSVWPLFMVINELPYKLRMLKENMIMAGLWFGPHKPAMGTYLSPFLDSFKRLHDGINCFSPSLGNFISKGYLLCGTADLPARCLVCNGVQFNGAYSCWKCMQKGETAKRGKGHTHVFPYLSAHPKGPERTVNAVCRDAQEALDNLERGTSRPSVNGVKGPSWLTFFPKFDIVNGIAIDYMHGVLLGVQKLMLRLWFAAEFSTKNFSFHKHVKDVDNRLRNLKPSLDISRLPRSIENDLKYWKASEYRSFLLYFGAPVLYGILDSVRFQHFLHLVNAMHILLKEGSSHDQISDAESMLFNFCADFEVLYDKCFMTLNIHQLLHLADNVRFLGPLFTHSCFSFEDKNGCLLKMIQGTQHIDSQIVTGVSFLQKLPELKQKYVKNTVEGSKLEKLFNSIESPSVLIRCEMIEKGVYVLGGVKSRDLTRDEYRKLCDYLGHAPIIDKFSTFKRIDFFNHIIYGLEYARMMKRDNSTVMYFCGDAMYFGRVRFFLLINDKSTVIALIETLNCLNFSEHCNILRVQKTGQTKFIAMKNVKEGCMFLEVQSNIENICYVCRYPNRIESD